MFQIKNNFFLKIGVFILAGFVACAGLVALGYWAGQRALRQQIAEGRGGADPSSHWATNPPPAIPPNASPEMKEFLQNQAILQQKLQQARGTGNGVLSPQAFAQFRQDNADLLKRQNDLAQIISKQQSTNTLAEPPPLQLSPQASPQQQAFATARDKLMREEIAFMNQHANDDLATRQAAMEKWRKDNAAKITQLQQLAKAASATATGTATTATK